MKEPITLASENGLLDVLMVAKPAPINTFPNTPTGWVYEICRRAVGSADTCAYDPTQNYYGGTLLKLQAGDLLKIHLVNKLPKALDSKHSTEPGFEFLTSNPTNIHTHGMLVSPHVPSADDPTWGDNVFVLTFNSANGKVTPSPHAHSVVRYDYTDYSIRVPPNHPSGLFWFHPHAHGLALNQVSAGMAGLITVGSPADYVCKTGPCSNPAGSVNVRHMMLKDAQILPDNTLLDQEDPGFCAPDRAPGERPRLGSCPGQNNSGGDEGGGNYTGGSWYFTLNGQRYPSIPVAPGGEIWRIANTSGSVTYDLTLLNPAQRRNMLMQVISVDGVSVSPPAGAAAHDLQAITGGKFNPEACPDAGPITSSSPSPLCTRKLHMMPSSRIEVWVEYRDSNDKVVPAPPGAAATFRTEGYQTGPDGDAWPQVELARVTFPPSQTAGPASLAVSGQANTLGLPHALAADLNAVNQSVARDVSCKPLAPGHIRRIFYGVPTTNLEAFGLAYEEIDEHGNVVGPPATDVTPFDPMYPTICVALGPGNTPTIERWELINVATEDHNFHLHQTKFRVLSKDEIDGTVLPKEVMGKGVMLDNLPLAHATGTCGNNPPDDPSNPIADWRAGLCTTTPIVIEIPFTIAGDYVYHCHILEHEDGGMMARIRVRPN